MRLEEQLLEIFNDSSLEHAELSDRIKAALSQYTLTQKDWEKYCHFSDLHYTRNLVATHDKFELIVRIYRIYLFIFAMCNNILYQVLCWKAGQASRIHNHAGSNCWMGVLQGPMIENLYHKVLEGRVICERANPSLPGDCPNLRLTSTSEYQKGKFSLTN